ncbi:MAG: hypothetical protein J6333_10065 [Planctomycetes bacterium]|nr:hypothetical protein [Planctomycetota bacterium]
MSHNKRLFTRRRAVLLLILAAVVGCAALAVSSLHSLLERQRRAERRAAELSVEERLKVARRLADGYVADRLAARARLERQLTQQAVALCGEVRVFLQASLLGREAR